MTNEQVQTLTRWEWRRLATPRAELILGLVAALVSIIVIGVFTQDRWFVGDAWDFLTTRSLSDPASMLRPHAGHLVPLSAILYRVFYGLFGMDFWPWFFLPRLLGFAAMAFVVWRALRWRGADPLIAFGVYLILLFFGISEWQSLTTFGSLVVYFCGLGLVWLVIERPNPSNRDRFKFLMLLLLAFFASTQAIAWFGGLVVGLVFARRLRPWWPMLAIPLAAYALWFLVFRSSSGSSMPDLSLQALLNLPEQTLVLLAYLVEFLLPIPETYAPVLATLLLAAVAWLLHKGRLGLYEGILFTAIGVFLAMIILVRVGDAPGRLQATRYSHFVAILLALALVPHLQFRRKSALYGAVLVLLGGIWAYNIYQLHFRLQWMNGVHANTRQYVETSAHLLAAGEPAAPQAPIHPPRTGMLSAAGLQRLVDDGWNPPPSPDSAIVEEVRGRLRMGVRNRGRIQGTLPVVGLPVRTPQKCVRLAPAQPVGLQVAGSATIRLTAPPGTAVALRWTDVYGTGTRQIDFGKGGIRNRAFIQLAEPPGAARMEVEVVEGRPAELCGLARAGAEPPADE